MSWQRSVTYVLAPHPVDGGGVLGGWAATALHSELDAIVTQAPSMQSAPTVEQEPDATQPGLQPQKLVPRALTLAANADESVLATATAHS